MHIIVSIVNGHLVNADQEIPVEHLEVKDGNLFVTGQRHEVVFLADHHNKFIGLGTDADGVPCVRSRCLWFDGLRDRDEEIDWCWGDVMLAPIISTKEATA